MNQPDVSAPILLPTDQEQIVPQTFVPAAVHSFFDGHIKSLYTAEQWMEALSFNARKPVALS
ncbi:hypothetical protein NZD89_11545 [Alicyclobacillus fastidiosus]|uniref:Uncharacterized protein n=1 Tax=Alicyclobacillus fastidiosus TaxID=392011 RepID=A0ABY6ZM04_9BACL|nr:hypothetical protein [Alicyclobacillus fastidiosus]WAH43958.1 hypothetical protein NZD89_11545 [Alicyclobacillus fastidiosus]